MKLSPELKEKIEDYFKNIHPDYLVDILVNEYGFKEKKKFIKWCKPKNKRK
jgi:hypothetical protein